MHPIRPRLIRTLVLSLFLLMGIQGGEVRSVRFRTPVTPPVARFPAELQSHEPVFRLGLNNMPEGALILGGLAAGSKELGLSSEQTSQLTALMTDVYGRISADTEMKASSALPYCFAPRKPSTGHYFLYLPDPVPEDPQCIIFLHGYGGNFLFYPWVLKEEFPDAVILVPSWGMSWYGGSTTYLRYMIDDAEKRIRKKLNHPLLMGISAGGRGGFRIYANDPDLFAGFVCIANAPESAVLPKLPSAGSFLLLNGTRDEMVPVEVVRRIVSYLEQQIDSFLFKEIEGGHFFLLTHRKETFAVIRDFIDGLKP